MVMQLSESTASADWLRARKKEKQLSKSRGFTDFVRTVVPNAEVEHRTGSYSILKGGRLKSYGPIQILSKSEEGELPELVIAGYASPQVVDREKHVITKEALARDLPRFMALPEYRNANLLHSNVQVAKVLPYWIGPDGKRWETKVDDIGLFVVVQVRTDPARPKICDKVAEDIRSGKLQAFSISADAPYESRRYECSGGTCFWVIDAVELYEVTICETPVNQDAMFIRLTKSYDVVGEFSPYMFCEDGSCPLSFRQANTVLKGQGITDFSTVREEGVMQRGPHKIVPGDVGERRGGPGLAGAAGAGERLNDNPQAPLDLEDIGSGQPTADADGHRFEDIFNPDNPNIIPIRDVGNDVQKAMGLSYGQMFDLFYADPSGGMFDAAIDLALYGDARQNTADEEDYYLNEQTGYVAIEPEHMNDLDTTKRMYGFKGEVKFGKEAGPKIEKGFMAEPYNPTRPAYQQPRKDPGKGSPGPILNLNGTAEHFHLALKHDLGQTTPSEELRLAQLSKDNEASGFPPDSASGMVIVGTDDPPDPELQGRVKSPKLQPPVTGTPSIMRSMDEAFSRVATRLDLARDDAAAIHAARVVLSKGGMPAEWTFGAWQIPGERYSWSAYVTELRNLAVQQGDEDLVLRLGRLRKDLGVYRPITLNRGRLIAKELNGRARAAGITGSMLRKAMPSEEAGPDPKRDLMAILESVAKIVHRPETRQRVAPKILHALDTIYDEAKRAVDGLDLGLSIGLSADGQLPTDDPKVQYRPAELASERCGLCRHYRDNETCELVMGSIEPNMVCDLFSSRDPEHEAINNAGAHSTMRDVIQADQLLSAVEKARLLKSLANQPSQEEAEAEAAVPAVDHSDSAMIAYYPTSGTARQLAQEGGEGADELHLTVVYLGKLSNISPEQQKAILEIVQRHVAASPPIEGEITNIDHFPPSPSSDGRTPVIARVAADDLHIFRCRLVEDLEQAGIQVPKTFKNYQPHITLRYDSPGMDDMQERGIPEIQSTPIMVDRLHVVYGGKKHTFDFDAGGATQIHGKDPQELLQTRAGKSLHVGDEDARVYAALYNRMWHRSFGDSRYSLAVLKDDGEIIRLDD